MTNKKSYGFTIESPLFQSSMELLGHSLTHYNGKNELDRKLVILHLANAIELILKDLLLNEGVTIYKGPKETITIYACISSLEDKGIQLPFRNKIDLLIDERNALQHRFGSPNQLTTLFYMNIAQGFFKEVLKKHYGLEYDEIIGSFADEQELAALKLSDPSNDKELEKLQELAKLHPLGALLSAWLYLERITTKFMKQVNLDDFEFHNSFIIELSKGMLGKYGIEIPLDLMIELTNMRQKKNMATHGQVEPTQEDVINTINTIKDLEKHLETLDIEKIRFMVQEEKKSDEIERINQLNRRKEMELRQQIAMKEYAKINSDISKINLPPS